jgi:hypothetical protein
MKIRRLLFASVLSALFLSSGLFTASPSSARACPYDWCVTLYNECEAQCNGARPCIKACQNDYSTCVCSNCGLCPAGDLPQAESKEAAKVE